MSTLLDRITSRIDRLRTAPAEVKRAARKPVAEQAPVPDPSAIAEPLTMASLTAALDRLAEERARQLAIVNGAEAERDRVLDAEDGDDGELLEIDRRVALARLALDRLSRLEEEAYEQLAPLRLAEQQRQWAHARDQYLQLAQTVHACMEEYERAANRLWSCRAALFNPVGVRDWEQQVPGLPHFMRAAPQWSGQGLGFVLCDSHQFRAENERFSSVMIGPASVQLIAFPDRMARYIDGKMSLEELAPSTSVWGGQGEDVAAHPVLVRLTRSVTLPEGEILAMGALVRVRAEHARELVTANRAVLSDTLTALSGTLPVGADLPLRELPLPAGSAA